MHNQHITNKSYRVAQKWDNFCTPNFIKYMTEFQNYGYPVEVNALFTTVSSIRVSRVSVWLVSGIALNKYRCE